MAVPLQSLKRFGEADAGWINKLVFGDNLQVLKTLLEMKEKGELRNADGSHGVRLCYIDPPFATKREFRTTKNQLAYRDKVEGAEFVEFLRRRLVFIHELLTDDGTLYLHLNTSKVHYMKVLLDEIFGSQNLIGEIVWKRTSGHGDAVRWSPVHETILCYSKTGNFIWNTPREPLSEEYAGTKYVHDDEDGRGKYRLDNLTSPNPRPNMTYDWQGFPPPPKGWRYSRATMDELDADGRIYKPADKTKRPQLKRYLEENEGRAVDDVWTDIPPVNSQALERRGYPTQKPLALLDRIIYTSTNEGDVVLDCFSGSGTTAVSAEQLGRRWIGVDCGKLATYVSLRRLLSLTEGNGSQPALETTQPFELCTAGLYDNQILEGLSQERYELFCLELFGCQPGKEEIGGITMAGRRKGGPVHCYPFKQTELVMGREYIESLDARLRSKVSGPIYIIAPVSHCDPGLFEDVVTLDESSYFILRVPYSVIEALHAREFELPPSQGRSPKSMMRWTASASTSFRCRRSMPTSPKLPRA
jgi:DNA modification methylase